MKSRFYINLVYATLAFVLFSCDAETEKKSVKYFVKFKFNGEFRLFQTKDPGYQSCGNCACATIPPLGTDYVDLNFCNDENDWITTEDIEGWESTDIAFSGSSFPIASFYFEEGGVLYSTEYASSQSTSMVEIISVKEDGLFADTFQQYRVKGTFQCKVRADGGLSDIAITEGAFEVRYSED